MKILLAFDGGEPAHRALDRAAELARQFGAEVSVVSVVPVRPGRSPMDPWDDTAIHDGQLAEAADLLRTKGIEPQLLRPFGDPATTIERIAEEGEFDLVVVGSRGLGPVSRFFQGSVSEHVATHANATVLVAR